MIENRNGPKKSNREFFSEDLIHRWKFIGYYVYTIGYIYD